MIVRSSINFYQNKNMNNSQNNSKKPYATKPAYKTYAVSFGDGGLGTGTFIYLVAKYGFSALTSGPKHNKISKFVKEVNTVLDNPEINLNELPNTLTALSKTPDKATRGTYYSIIDINRTGMSIYELKHKALEKSVLSKLPDSNYVVIESKKDFIRSLFNSGHEISGEFIKEFEKLDDNIYKNFKQEIIDKCLFSKEYRQKRNERDLDYKLRFSLGGRRCDKAETARRTVALIDTLDKNIHSEYLERIKPIVVNYKKEIFDSLKHDELYMIFQKGFESPREIKDLYEQDKYAKMLVMSTIEKYSPDYTKISDILNLNYDLAEDMAEDINALKKIEDLKSGSNEELLYMCADKVKAKSWKEIFEAINMSIEESVLVEAILIGQPEELAKALNTSVEKAISLMEEAKSLKVEAMTYLINMEIKLCIDKIKTDICRERTMAKLKNYYFLDIVKTAIKWSEMSGDTELCNKAKKVVDDAIRKEAADSALDQPDPHEGMHCWDYYS